MHKILSQRAYEKWPSWDIVYEWEDVLSEKSGWNIEYISESSARIRKFLWYRTPFKALMGFSALREDANIIFCMNSNQIGLYSYINTIPIFIDTPVSSVDILIKSTNKLSIFFVTSLEFYKLLLSKGIKNVRFIPLSVPDKLVCASIPEKDIDVLQFGRINEKLHSWMLKYCKLNPDVEYVYRDNTVDFSYYSTKRGKIGTFSSRDDYVNLLRRTRISLVSTPCCDQSRDFGGIDFVTPRFYESSAAWAYLVGRYTNNDETKYVGLSDICPNINNYAEFDDAISCRLKSKDFLFKSQNEKFLKENVASNRLEELIHEVSESLKKK